jgi:protein gp37
MAETTHISWADATFNPWIGCTKVSPACDGCYAEHLMANRHKRVVWGGERSRTSEGYWRGPLNWNRKAIADGSRPFVFCSSLADVFDNQVPAEWRADLFALIRQTPALVWLLLTKRPGMIGKLSAEAGGLPPNAALGATFANQEEWDRDSSKLAAAGAALDALFTFGSFEPLLGRIKFGEWMPDWLITGGETDQGAHKARPQHFDWFREIRDQAAATGKAFHHKQHGEHVEIDGLRCRGGHGSRQDRGPDVFWLTREGERLSLDDGRARFLSPYGASAIMKRVGKATAGRMLDGVIHDARPEVRR